MRRLRHRPRKRTPPDYRRVVALAQAEARAHRDAALAARKMAVMDAFPSIVREAIHNAKCSWGHSDQLRMIEGQLRYMHPQAVANWIKTEDERISAQRSKRY
jgi:hypothetical protein